MERFQTYPTLPRGWPVPARSTWSADLAKIDAPSWAQRIQQAMSWRKDLLEPRAYQSILELPGRHLGGLQTAGISSKFGLPGPFNGHGRAQEVSHSWVPALAFWENHLENWGIVRHLPLAIRCSLFPLLHRPWRCVPASFPSTMPRPWKSMVHEVTASFSHIP